MLVGGGGAGGGRAVVEVEARFGVYSAVARGAGAADADEIVRPRGGQDLDGGEVAHAGGLARMDGCDLF